MAGVTLTQGKTIVENTDRKLTVFFTGVYASGGDDATVVNIIDLDDASSYKQDGSALAANGFAHSDGSPLTDLIIMSIKNSASTIGASAFSGSLDWHSDTPLPITFIGTSYDSSLQSTLDFTSVSGLKNPRATGYDGDLEINMLGMGAAGDAIMLTIECIKRF
tara:strand:+ start:411 stop:899 length:489 start_codon:yes stop_codon:yes gene_type:complete